MDLPPAPSPHSSVTVSQNGVDSVQVYNIGGELYTAQLKAMQA